MIVTSRRDRNSGDAKVAGTSRSPLLRLPMRSEFFRPSKNQELLAPAAPDCAWFKSIEQDLRRRARLEAECLAEFNQPAALSTYQRGKSVRTTRATAGHLEFKAEILDESGNTTSADRGHTYRKLLCIAFDMALLRAHLDQKFPRFVYHDGVFESLDDRKKENLLTVIRNYAELGIQSIITLIDSDLPPRDKDADPVR